MPEEPLTSARSDDYTEDPLLGFQFKLTLEGKIAGYFTEVSGVGSEHEIVEHSVVNESGVEMVMKIPGRLKWQDVTLKRGITTNMEIWEWREECVKGKVEDARTNATIAMLGRDGATEQAIWHFKNAWPSKVSGPTLKADANEIAIEEVSIVHEGMYREK